MGSDTETSLVEIRRRTAFGETLFRERGRILRYANEGNADASTLAVSRQARVTEPGAKRPASTRSRCCCAAAGLGLIAPTSQCLRQRVGLARRLAIAVDPHALRGAPRRLLAPQPQGGGGDAHRRKVSCDPRKRIAKLCVDQFRFAM
jgi:hypothetical protein